MNDSEREVRDIMRRNRWLVLSTAGKKGAPHSSVVMYVSDGKMVCILTSKETLKARNIKENNRVAVAIPFWKGFFHRMMKRVPPAEIHFSGEAEVLPYDDERAKTMYRKVLNYELSKDAEQDAVWIQIKPSSRIACYGVDVSLLTMRKPEKARRTVQLSE